MDPQQSPERRGDDPPRTEGQIGSGGSKARRGGDPGNLPEPHVTQRLQELLSSMRGVEVLAGGNPFAVTQNFGSEKQSQWALPFVGMQANAGDSPTLSVGVALEQDAYLLYPLVDGRDIIAALRAVRLIGLLPAVSAASVKLCVESVSPRLPEIARRMSQEQLAVRIAEDGDIDASRAREQVRQSMLSSLEDIDPLLQRLQTARFPVQRQELYLALRQGIVTNSPLVAKAAYSFIDGLAGTRAPLPAYSAVWQRAEESLGQRLLGGFSRGIRGIPDTVSKQSIHSVLAAFRRLNAVTLMEQGVQTRALWRALQSDPAISLVLVKSLGMQQQQELCHECRVLSLSLIEFAEKLNEMRTSGDLFASIRRLNLMQQRFARIEQAFAFCTQEAMSDPDSAQAPDALALQILFKAHIAGFNAQVRQGFGGILEEVPARLVNQFAMFNLRPSID